MTLLGLAARNLRRNRFRTILTALGVAVAVLAFCTLRTVITAWNAAIDHAVQDRIATRHKVTFVMPVPHHYIDEVRQISGIRQATFASWFGGRDPRMENDFFATIAVDTGSFLDVYDEIVVPDDQKSNWLQNRKGALIGDALAHKHGWKVGDKVTLGGTIYPGDWEFDIDGIYTTTRKSVDRSTLWFHWKYLNESIPQSRRDEIGWIVSRVDDAGRSADISRAVDAAFDDNDVQTLSMSERAMNNQFMASFTAVLKAIDIVSMVILLIMTLVIGNTIAMGTRERTGEFGILRAIGFLPRHVAILVLGEGLFTAAVGAGLGLLLAYPLIERGLGRWLEENMGAFFPYFRIDPSTSLIAVGLSCVLGVVAALIPAIRSARLNPIEAIRRVA